MAYDKTHKAIAQRIGTKWTDTQTIIVAENQPFPTVDGKQPQTPWVRWSLRPAARDDLDVGGVTERDVGVIYFQVFVPENKGTRQAYTIAAAIAAIFNDAGFTTESGGGMITRRVNGPIFAGNQDGWIQHNLTVPYQEDAPALNAS